MYVHEEAKAIFLCHPRTASRSTSEFLVKHGFEKVGRENRDKVGSKASTGHHGFLLEPPPPGFVVGCTVRHHFQLVTSWLFATRFKKWDGATDKSLEQLRKGVPSFPTFLSSLYNMGKSTYYRDGGNKLFPQTKYANHIVEFDNLMIGLSTFMAKAGILLNPQITLPLTGQEMRRGCTVDRALLPEWRQSIVDRYHDEMVELGYLVDDKVVPY
jgi:hypothetical protein